VCVYLELVVAAEVGIDEQQAAAAVQEHGVVGVENVAVVEAVVENVIVVKT
jgi:hypothetical protein